MPPLTNKEYTVGWICALPLEMAAATAMLDEEHGKPTRQDPNDKNSYTLGRVGQHNIIIACLPGGVYGTISAATVAIQMLSSFGSIKFGLMIGIGGGVPSSVHDIRLGDVVVSKPKGKLSGVLQYDFGKTVEQGQIIPMGSLNKPPQVLLTAIASLEAAHLKRENNISRYISEMLLRNPQMQQRFAYQDVKNDQLYEAYYQHVGGSTCENCDSSKLLTRPMRDKLDPVVFYGTIGSGNQVMKDGVTRDNLARQHDVLCFEMEAAGLMDNFPCLVIRGICDYADSHKNKRWQEYAAATAAAYAKELLYTIPISDIEQTNHPTILTEHVNSTNKDRHLPLQSNFMDTAPLPASTFILTNRLYSKNDISLASLIPDRRYANQDALIGIAVKEGLDFSVSVDKGFSEFVRMQANTDSIFRKTISRLFLTPSVKVVGSDMQVLAEESRVYMLRQPKAVFQQLCSHETVKQWLQEYYSNKRYVHFVVGYRTVLNAQLVAKDMGTTVNRRLPVGIGDRNRYSTTGERIYAICFRKVTIKRFGNVNAEILDSTSQWKVFSDDRRAAVEADEVIEADIEDVDEVGESNLGVFSSEIGDELWTGFLSK